MLKLVIVRHASTVQNELNRLSGLEDSMLSIKGKKQSSALQKYLADSCVDEVYFSTSLRVKETIGELFNNKAVNIYESENLRELDFGDFDGLSFYNIKEKFPREYLKLEKEGLLYRFPNGESIVDSYKRVVVEIDKIIKSNKFNCDRTVLICAHAGSIRNILSYLLTNTYEHYWNFKIDNASVSIVEIEDGFSVLTMLNNTEFLK